MTDFLPGVPVVGAHPARKTGVRPRKGTPLVQFRAFARANGLLSPTPVDYLAPLRSGWQMLGNDAAGDCNAVRWANTRRLITATLTSEHYPSIDDVWELYATQNPGFVPGTGPHGYGSADDQGMDTQALLEHLHTNGGPDGVRPVAFAQIDPTDHEAVALAIDVLGGVWVDVLVLAGNQAQFSQGLPWTNVGGRIDGAHAILAGGTLPAAEPTEAFVNTETWAQESGLTLDYWTGKAGGYELVQTVYAVVWPEHLGTKAFQRGVDVTALAAEYRRVTGRDLVLPEPSPSANPDGDLATALAEWLSHNHTSRVNTALVPVAHAWLAAKGYSTAR